MRLQKMDNVKYFGEDTAVQLRTSKGFPEAIVQLPADRISNRSSDQRILVRNATPLTNLQSSRAVVEFAPIKCVTQTWDTTRTETDYSSEERRKAFGAFTPVQRGFEPVPGLKIMGCNAENQDYSTRFAYVAGSTINNSKDPEIEVYSKLNGITYGPYRLRHNHNTNSWDHGAQISKEVFDLQTNGNFVRLASLTLQAMESKDPTSIGRKRNLRHLLKRKHT